MNYKKITLDTERKSFESIIAMQGDNKSRYIDATIVNKSIPINLTGCTVKFSAIKPDITDIFNDVSITNPTAGKVKIELTNQTLSVPGVVQATLVILKEDMQLSVLPFFITVIENPYNPNAIESKSEYKALNSALTVVDGYAKELQDASVNLEEKYTIRLNYFDEQLDKNKKELTEKINEVASTGTTTEVLQATTKTYIDEKIEDGTIPNMTIEPNSITYDKLKDKCVLEKAVIDYNNNKYDYMNINSNKELIISAQSKCNASFEIGDKSSPYYNEKEIKLLFNADNGGNSFIQFKLSEDAITKVNVFGYINYGFWLNKNIFNANMNNYNSDVGLFIGLETDSGLVLNQALKKSSLINGYSLNNDNYTIKVNGEYGDYVFINISFKTTNSSVYKFYIGARYVATNSYFKISVPVLVLNNLYYYNRYENYYLKNSEEENSNYVKNKLYGKTIVGKGDSILNGANDTTGKRGWLGRIAEKNNMTMYNEAKNGALISYKEGQYHCIVNNISNLPNGDYFIFEGGANDYFNRIPLGEITTDYTGELDISTFCGAFESVCRQAISKYKGKKIGYIVVYKLLTSYEDRVAQAQYFDKAKEICRKYSIKYLDLFNTSATDYNTTPEYFYDTVHYNEKGYDVTYEPVESWLLTL